MIIELTRVFVDYDPEDKEFSKLKAKSKKAVKGKCFINPGWIMYLGECDFNPSLIEMWYDSEIIYVEGDIENLKGFWIQAQEEIPAVQN